MKLGKEIKANAKALFAVVRADLTFTFKNVSSAVFGIIFPLVFILTFGFIGDGGSTYDVVLLDRSDNDNVILDALNEIESINIVEPTDGFEEQLEKGQIAATLYITKNEVEYQIPNFDSTSGANPILNIDASQLYTYDVEIVTSAANPIGGGAVTSIISSVLDKMNLAALQSSQDPIVTLDTEQIEGREYSSIDFVLPGQLGFSLLSAGVFGTAFLLSNLRDTLVLKRFFATPVKKWVFILGIAISKLIYSMIQATVIIGMGYFAFDFTLIHGFATFLQMLLLSAIGLLAFLGMGLIISSIAKDANGIPPLANLITMPQFLLSGTFFAIDNFPDWLQPISRVLPLTFLNDAMRKVAFDGDSIFTLGHEMLGLGITIVVVYAIAIRVFKYGDR